MPAMITRRRSVMAGAIAVASSSCLAAARSAMAAEPDMGLRTPLPTQAPMTEALADLGNVKLWYWDTGGSGEVVVFLHPGSGSAEFFPYQQPAFAKASYRVICYSRRGQFRSEMGAETDKFFAADDLLALMDHLKVGKFHAVGSALGGYIGLDVALSRPERLQSLVLASSMMGIAEPDYQKTLEALRPKPFSELRSRSRKSVRPTVSPIPRDWPNGRRGTSAPASARRRGSRTSSPGRRSASSRCRPC